MKNIKKRIALIFSVACAATLLFTIPTFACDSHDNGKHGGVFYPTQAKSWFGSCDGSYQDKRNAEPTLDTEESVQIQPIIEEPVVEPVHEKSVDCQYKKWETDNQNEYNPWLKSRTSITKDNLYAFPEFKLNKSSNWKTKLTTQSESDSWGIRPTRVIIKDITPFEGTDFTHGLHAIFTKIKVEKDNQQNIDEYSPQKAGLRYYIKGYWHLTDKSVKKGEEKVIYVPWYQTGESINNKKEQGMFIHAWQPIFPGTKEHEASPELRPIHGWGANSIEEAQRLIVSPKYRSIGIISVDFDKKTTPIGRQTYIKDETIQTIHTIARKLVYAPWENNFSQDFVHRVIHAAPAIKEDVSKPQLKEWHGFIGANRITRPAQTTTIYKSHNPNTDMRTIHIRELETFGPYAVNNNRKFSDEYGKLVPRQIQHIEPHRIVEDNIYKKDSTQPQKWIINELRTPETRISGHWGFEEELASHLRIQFYHGGIANESTRKDIGFILLRHGVPVIHNNENIYHLEPSRIRHIYPSVMDEKHGISRFVPVFDNASTTKFEKPRIGKMRIYNPFTTSNSSSNTEFYLRPLGVGMGLIMQTVDLANKPQLVKLAKSMRNNEEIRKMGHLRQYYDLFKLSFEKPIEINFAPANVDAKTIKTTIHTILQEMEELTSRIRHIYPAKVFEDTLSKGKDIPFITKHFVSVFDSANIKELEKPGIVKVRLLRPFTTSVFSNNTEVYLSPLGLTIGLIINNENLANKPISTMIAQLIRIAKPIQNNEEIQRRGMEYRVRESLGHSYLAIFPTVNKELRGKIAGVSHTTINQNFKVKMSEIWPIAPVITNPTDGRYMAHPLHVILRELLIPEEERLGTYIPLPSDEKLKSATIKTHTYRLKEVQNNKFVKVISLAPEINGAGKATIIKILTGEPMVNRPMRTATIMQLFLKKGQLETATQLGGGQHQRVAVARQLLPYFC